MLCWKEQEIFKLDDKAWLLCLVFDESWFTSKNVLHICSHFNAPWSHIKGLETFFWRPGWIYVPDYLTTFFSLPGRQRRGWCSLAGKNNETNACFSPDDFLFSSSWRRRKKASDLLDVYYSLLPRPPIYTHTRKESRERASDKGSPFLWGGHSGWLV